MDIDEFLASVRHPSSQYQPNGNGTYAGYPPCVDCGSTAFLLTGDAPECLVCSTTEENVKVYSEALVGALDRLTELAPTCPPKVRAELHSTMMLAQFAVARLVYGTAAEA